jgi:hypothetical protein
MKTADSETRDRVLKFQIVQENFITCASLSLAGNRIMRVMLNACGVASCIRIGIESFEMTHPGRRATQMPLGAVLTGGVAAGIWSYQRLADRMNKLTRAQFGFRNNPADEMVLAPETTRPRTNNILRNKIISIGRWRRLAWLHRPGHSLAVEAAGTEAADSTGGGDFHAGGGRWRIPRARVRLFRPIRLRWLSLLLW